MWTAMRHADPPLNDEAREFRPRNETPRDGSEVGVILEEHSVEEHVEERHGVDEKSEAPVEDQEDKQSEAEKLRERPKRVQQSRHIYTYDQLGQPTLQQLKTCPVSVRESSGISCDLPVRSSSMYPFCHE